MSTVAELLALHAAGRLNHGQLIATLRASKPSPAPADAQAQPPVTPYIEPSITLRWQR